MTKVQYRPEDGSPSRTTTLGYDFDASQPTEVTDAKVLAKLRANRFFIVDEDAPIDPGPGLGLRAVHRGRGVYGIADGGVQLDQLGPMTKADADAFNALSDADKAVFVDKPAASPDQSAPAPVVVPASPVVQQ